MTELFPVFFVLLYFCFSFTGSVKRKHESTLLIRIGQIVFQVQDRLRPIKLLIHAIPA